MNISEKIFQVLATCLLVSVHSRAAVQDAQHRESAGQLLSNVFTTGYSDQLMFYTVNEETGHVSIDDTCAVQPQLSFGHVSQRYNSIYFVHLVNEYNGTLNTGAVSRWEMNISTMEKDESIIMKEVFLTGDCGPNQNCMSGEAPCHVIVDEENGILHVANYGVNYGGSYIAYSIDKKDGTIQQVIYFEDYGKGSNVDPARQENAHANMVYLIKNFVYVVDLGSDKIHRYKVMGEDSKETVYQGKSNVPPGFGPRHMTDTTKFSFQDGYQRAYVINEL